MKKILGFKFFKAISQKNWTQSILKSDSIMIFFWKKEEEFLKKFITCKNHVSIKIFSQKTLFMRETWVNGPQQEAIFLKPFHFLEILIFSPFSKKRF